MKSINLFLLLSLLFCFLPNAGNAQIKGSQIDYRCLGNSRYEVFLHLERYASDSILPDPVIRCKVGTSTLLTGDSLLKLNQEYSDTFNYAQCAFFDSVFLYKHIRHTITSRYRAVFDLSSYADCRTVFYIREAQTDSTSTNFLPRPFYYNQTEVNRCLSPCDSTLQLKNYIQTFLTPNRDVNLDFGPEMDSTSEDSLVYDFFPIRTDDSSIIQYNSPFYSHRWIRFFGFPNQNLSWPAGLRLDSFTGIMRFRPTSVNQNASVLIRIERYREVNGRDTLVGIKYVEKGFITNNYFNSPPGVKGPYTYTACLNQELCISLQTFDTDPHDSLSLTIVSNNLPNSTVTESGTMLHPWKKICWTPDSSMINNQIRQLITSTQDNACPTPATLFDTFYVRTWGYPEFDYLIKKNDSCSELKISIQPKPGYDFTTALWNIIDSVRKDTISHNQLSGEIPVQKGTYYIHTEISHPSLCKLSIVDSHQVKGAYPPQYTIHKHHFTGCEEKTDTLGVIQADSVYTYLWNDGNTDQLRYISLGLDTDYYVLQVRNSSCVKQDSFWIYANEAPSLSKQFNWTGKDTLIINILNPLPTADYIWYLDHSTKGRNAGPQIEFVLIDDSKDHFVKVEGINYRCAVSDTFTVPAKTHNPQTSLLDHSGRTINAFPNPFSYHLSIQAIQMERINIYSMSGVLLYSKPCNGSDEEQLYLPELAAGMYILEVQSKGISNRIKVNLVR